jgi:hypothetical protein
MVPITEAQSLRSIFLIIFYSLFLHRFDSFHVIFTVYQVAPKLRPP